MRIYKNDIIKASAISTGADRGVLLCSITDSGFTSIVGVISAVKDRLPNEDHKIPSLKQTGFLDTNVRNPRFYNRWNHPYFPTRKCPSEVARQGKYNV